MKKSILFFCLFFLWLNDYAQQHRFIAYNVSNGLSQNSVHCIFQDSDGKLWLGTQDGLNSFDGRNFKHYKYNTNDTTTISDQFILSITEDNKGFLWVGTRNGLNKLNKRTGKFQRYYLSAGEKDRIATTYHVLSKNGEGEIYVPHQIAHSLINANGELEKLDIGLTKKNYAYFTNKKTLWRFNNKHELCSLSIANKNAGEKTIATLPTTENAANYTFAIDNKEVVWCYPINASGRLFFYDLKQNNWKTQAINISSIINTIYIAKNGDGWICTLDGIYVLKNYAYLQKINADEKNSSQLPAGNILSAYEDNQSNIWVGTGNGGFAYYNPSFDNYNLLQLNAASQTVTSVVEFADNAKWLATTNGLYQTKQNLHLFIGKRVTALAKDKQNQLWAAVQNEGLYILNNQGKIVKSYTQSDSLLQTKKILNLFCDSKGRVILCTEVGYFIFTNTTQWQHFTNYNTKNGTTGAYVLHAFEDDKKNIWFSKNLGVDVLNENNELIHKISSATAQSLIQRTIVTGCTQDKEGNIWIATLSSGIYKYANKQLKQYTIFDGLSTNIIYGIICDDNGKLWATTTSGINIFAPAQNKFYVINSKDGLPADDYVLGALFKNDNGKVLVGSSKGLITINADSIAFQNRKAAAQIGDIKLNGTSIEVFTQPYILQPDFKTISFELSIKEALQPRSIIYQYKLKGVDEDWNTLPIDNNVITYSSLPYKKLLMQVRAAYSLQEMNDAAIKEFEIIAKAPFYKTIWFVVLLFLCSAALLLFAFRQYMKQKNRKQLQVLQMQKELQQERERISRDLHDNIGAYTSALVAGINRIKDNNFSAEEVNELGDYATSIMGYLRETIWVLNNEKLTLTAFSDRFKNYANRIIKSYPSLTILFDVQIHDERTLTPQISLNLFRILQEALQNACKHANATVIEVKIFQQTKIHILVADNGKGIDGVLKEDNYGIANMKQRAAEINFNLYLTKGIEKGTVVMLDEQ